MASPDIRNGSTYAMEHMRFHCFLTQHQPCLGRARSFGRQVSINLNRPIFQKPISAFTSAIAATKALTSLTPIRPMLPMRKQSPCVSLPG